jgi:hypothetical protein
MGVNIRYLLSGLEPTRQKLRPSGTELEPTNTDRPLAATPSLQTNVRFFTLVIAERTVANPTSSKFFGLKFSRTATWEGCSIS